MNDGKTIAVSYTLADEQGIDALLACSLDKLNSKYGYSYDSVQVFLDTPNTVFVPQELISVTPPSAFIEDASIVVNEMDAVVVTESVEDVCAVTVFDKAVVDRLMKMFSGSGIHFYSPLHEELLSMRKSGSVKKRIVMYPTSENVYVIRYDKSGRLVLTEVYPCKVPADALYYVSELTAADNGEHTKIALYGDYAKPYAAVLKKYCRRVSIV